MAESAAPPDPRIRPYAPDDRQALIELWVRCGVTRPWNDPGLDIDRKLAVDDGLLVAVARDGALAGAVMAGYDGHRGWVNYLAVDPTHRRGGLGRRLMAAAEHLLAARGCPKINLQIRHGNDDAVAFYRAIGFDVDPVVSMGKRLVDDGSP